MSDKRVKTALFGVGKWGANVARELRAQSELVAFSSRAESADQSSEVAGIPWRSAEDIASDSTISAVAIATPITTHATLVRDMLTAGKHVLCEKPLAETAREAESLAALAAEKDLTLMTGYVFLYHPVYAELKRLLMGKTISRVECVWNKYGTFGESIEMNLLTHHLSIAYDLLGKPESGSYTKREAGESACDILNTELSYANAQFISRIDRVSQEKNHLISVTADDVTYVWDSVKLLLQDEVVFESTEQPLTKEIETFLRECAGQASAATSGTFGANVLKMHELIR